ncbi:MAG: carboxypeptidase-like regulatory domain-containing protein [Ferruginibacter sp.]
MPQEKDIKYYGAEDFERYHSGKMTEEEMHALEKAALDDPFLSDSLDGYLHTKTAGADINELRNKLLLKEKAARVVWYKKKTIAPLLRIAAILIFFAGFGWLLYNNNRPKQDEIAAIEVNNNKKELPGTVGNKISDSSRIKKEEGLITVIPDTETKQQPVSVEKNGSYKLAEKKQTLTASNATIIASGATGGYTLNQNNITEIADSVSVSNSKAYYTNIQPESNNNNDNALAGKVSGIQVATQKKIRGRITDSKGNPVSFANVIDKKNNIGVQSDWAGSFAITSPDSAPKVDVNAIGYKTITKALSNDSTANNLVLLEQDNSIKEVVVTNAFETKRSQRSKSASGAAGDEYKADNNERITITNAIPVNGWQDFNKYVSDSLKTLQQLGPTSVSAEILVSFDVNDKGEPVDINVKKSLCNSCDAEAIRIMKNSPPLKLNRKSKKANAVVRF